MHVIYDTILTQRKEKRKAFAVLLDPDKLNPTSLQNMIELGNSHHVDYFFVGGSLLTDDSLSITINAIKSNSKIPVIIFPGSNNQICKEADGILLLSLISGRNADALIGQHVVAAPLLKKSGLEILSTGYILIDCGKQTTVSYISNTTPIPSDKPEIAACTAMAGELLGLKLIYLDGGSGALHPVNEPTIRAVRKAVNNPIIVGGGINTSEKAYQALSAGADIIVVGNGIEKNPSLLEEIASVVTEMNAVTKL